MSGSACERLRELAPELALGIADGEARAAALEHLADCPECRAELERLAAVGDELPLLAPAAEPPPGFEQRVAAPMRPPARGPRIRARALTAGAALAAAVAAAALVWLALGDDRELADSYRETLAVADGEYFDAAALEVPGGERAGYVYGYQGRASWVLAVIYDGVPAGSYELEAVTADGRRLPALELTVVGDDGSAGAVIDVDYDQVRELRLLDRRGREVADAELDEG